MRRWRFWVGLVLVPVALAILVSLGTWQVKRLYWKEALIASIDKDATHWFERAGKLVMTKVIGGILATK